MKALADHEIKLWLTASQYLAIKHLAERDDRAMSAYLRRVVESHLNAVSEQEAEIDRRADSPARDGAGREDRP